MCGLATPTPATRARALALEARPKVCGERPDVWWYTVSNEAVVRVAGRGDPKIKKAIEQEFLDCVFGTGRWKQWVPGQPPPHTAYPPLPPVSSPASGATPASTRTADRLQELDGSKARGLISEEYQATRKRILDGL